MVPSSIITIIGAVQGTGTTAMEIRVGGATLVVFGMISSRLFRSEGAGSLLSMNTLTTVVLDSLCMEKRTGRSFLPLVGMTR